MSTSPATDIPSNYCEVNSLLTFVPATVNTVNLDRVISYLLNQDREKSTALVNMKEKMQKQYGHSRATVDDLRERLRIFENQQKEKSSNNTDELFKIKETITAVEDHSSLIEQSVSQLSKRTSEIESDLLTNKENDKLSTTELTDIRNDVQQLFSSTAAFSEMTASTVTQDQIATLSSSLSSLQEGVNHDKVDINYRIDQLYNTDSTLKSQIQTLKSEISDLANITELQIDKIKKLQKKCSDARIVLEERVDSLDLDHIGNSLESIAVSFSGLASEFTDTKQSHSDAITRLTDCDTDLGNKINELHELIKVGGYNSGVADGELSGLPLLNSKIGDILSILVLFESKVKKNEDAVQRVEEYILSTLKGRKRGLSPSSTTAAIGCREAATAALAQPEVIERKNALLRTKRLYRCLSCEQTVDTKDKQKADSRVELGGVIPGSRLRTHVVQQGKLAHGVVPTPIPTPPKQLLTSYCVTPVQAGCVPAKSGETPPSFDADATPVISNQVTDGIVTFDPSH